MLISNTDPCQHQHSRLKSRLLKPKIAKYGIVSLGATSIDFSVFHFLHFNFPIVTATATSVSLGGITSFLLNRFWVFQGTEGKLRVFAMRHFLCVIMGLALNSSGVWVFHSVLKLGDWESRVSISVIVGLFLYYVNKRYVYYQSSAAIQY